MTSGPARDGRPNEGPRSFHEPTVLLSDDPAVESTLAGCFGPVVLARGFQDGDEAVEAANASPFGLSGSVWGRDLRRARSVASRLEVGTVRGVVGLRELAQAQVTHARKPGGFRPHLFPYGPLMPKILSAYRRIFLPRG